MPVKNKAENAIQPEDDEEDWLFWKGLVTILMNNWLVELPEKNNREDTQWLISRYLKALPKIADKIINVLRLQYHIYFSFIQIATTNDNP